MTRRVEVTMTRKIEATTAWAFELPETREEFKQILGWLELMTVTDVQDYYTSVHIPEDGEISVEGGDFVMKFHESSSEPMYKFEPFTIEDCDTGLPIELDELFQEGVEV